MANGLDRRQERRARRRDGLTPPDGFMRLVTKRKYMSRSMKKALIEAERRDSRLVERPCSEGCCVELIDSETGENTGGWGPVGCPCQDDPDQRNTRDGGPSDG